LKQFLLTLLPLLAMVSVELRSQTVKDATLAAQKKDYQTALTILRQLASRNDAAAESSLGFMYYSGQGVATDLPEAARWFRKAADQGFLQAQYNLGHMYEHGEGLAKNATQAASWYRRAAEQGYSWAQFNLGVMYAEGAGIPKDPVEAAKLYRAAAEQGNIAPAQFNLALLFERGDGLPQSWANAVSWYRKAAEQGYPEAQLRLGWLNIDGESVPANRVEGEKWLRKAAEQGDMEAQFQLGDLYAKDKGIFRRQPEALQWYRKAAAQGHPKAQSILSAGFVPRISVSSKDQEQKVTQKVQPAFPPLARLIPGFSQREWPVLLRVVIGIDGHVKSAESATDPKPVNDTEPAAMVAGAIKMLHNAAIQAVSQWEYQPTVVNGDPVEVETLVTVTLAAKSSQ